jgi:Fanconi anemia group D2 protein
MVCSHSKEYKDTQIVAVVPGVRKSLESLVYSVKEVLSKQDALSAFWIGNLKHRTLAGEVVSSQLPSHSQKPEVSTSRKKKRTESGKSSKSTKKKKSEEVHSDLSASIVNSDEDEDINENKVLEDIAEESEGDSVGDEYDSEDDPMQKASVERFIASIEEDSEEDEGEYSEGN